jgi:hypothetical protein
MQQDDTRITAPMAPAMPITTYRNVRVSKKLSGGGGAAVPFFQAGSNSGGTGRVTRMDPVESSQ